MRCYPIEWQQSGMDIVFGTPTEARLYQRLQVVIQNKNH